MTDDSQVPALAAAWRESVAAADRDREALIEAVRTAHNGGASEYTLATLAGVRRNTVRAWLGKA